MGTARRVMGIQEIKEEAPATLAAMAGKIKIPEPRITPVKIPTA